MLRYGHYFAIFSRFFASGCLFARLYNIGSLISRAVDGSREEAARPEDDCIEACFTPRLSEAVRHAER